MKRLLPLLLLPVCLMMEACGSGYHGIASLTDKVVFTGDSITQFWGEQPQFKMYGNWTNKGIWGETSAQIAARFQRDVIDPHPDVVHIMAGTNDVGPGWLLCESKVSGLATATSPPQGDALKAQPETCSNLTYMVETAKRNGIRVVLGAIPAWACEDNVSCHQEKVYPTDDRFVRIDQLNGWIKTFAEKEGVTFVDYHTATADAKKLYFRPGLTSDGLHPNDLGYTVMQPLAEKALQYEARQEALPIEKPFR